jgi:hypothetical protein
LYRYNAGAEYFFYVEKKLGKNSITAKLKLAAAGVAGAAGGAAGAAGGSAGAGVGPFALAAAGAAGGASASAAAAAVASKPASKPKLPDLSAVALDDEAGLYKFWNPVRPIA